MSASLSISLHAVSVRRAAHWALRDVSLDLRAGERWALIGGNGAGKTQLLKVLATDVWPTPTGRERLRYSRGGRSVEPLDAKLRIAYVGAELQDKYARYGWNPSVAGLLATGLHRTDLLLRPIDPRERRQIERMLATCGLTRLAVRPFLALSYGQKRVALLARALIQKPDWLLLDEFYNGLDLEFRRRIDGILVAAARRGQAWVASAHRAMDVPRGTQRLVALEAGRVAGVSRLRRTDLTRLATLAEERPRPKPPAANVASKRPRTGRLLVRIGSADLYVDYRRVLSGVSWEVRRGEHWAVFGANGAGKSSLLKLIYGDLSPALGGTIERAGSPFGTPIADWKRRVGWVSPELQADYAVEVTILELVASGRYASIGLPAAPTAADLRHARHWLKFFSLTSLARRRPRELSYGQLRRALIARALAAQPELLLLDEPLTGLDPRQRAAMKRLLGRLMTRRRTLIIAVHHAEDLPRGMTHALHLHNRRAQASELQSAT